MSPASSEITHVSDTALMVAACRADETELDDAFVRDPFASRFAGERGRAILNALPYAGVMRIGLAIRTRFVDELLLDSLQTYSIATVLSVGCGLDTRPWRLKLSSRLRWIEIDFAAMLDYKDRLMSGETPSCHRERLEIDLNDPAQRRAMYEAAGRQPALMITEGSLLYLPAATVEALAADSFQHSGVARLIGKEPKSVRERILPGGARELVDEAFRHERIVRTTDRAESPGLRAMHDRVQLGANVWDAVEGNVRS